MLQHTIKPFVTKVPFILASGSPRRKELLQEIGLEFEIHPSCAEEPAPVPHENPEQYAKRMALLKTSEVASRFPQRVMLGADTIVVLGDTIMGKPSDCDDALEKLTALSGTTHHVISAFSLIFPDGRSLIHSVTTAVTMRLASQMELKAYIATGEPMDKAGAYAIQGIGSFLIESIHGSYTNVVGLPVTQVLKELLDQEIVTLQTKGTSNTTKKPRKIRESK